jgi:hypothetical protein
LFYCLFEISGEYTGKRRGKMKKIILLLLCLNVVFAQHVFGLPLPGEWNLEDGIAAVLDPEGDGGNIGDEAAGRDDSLMSSPDNAYFWSFEGLIRTENILGSFINNGNETAYRSTEIYRTGGTFILHGDNLWGQPPGTIYEVSIDSHFTGITHYQWINDGWEWKETTGSDYVWGEFRNYPFLFELTDKVHFDYYGYNTVVRHYVYFGTVTDAVMSIFPVPEPSTMLLFFTGLAGLAGQRFRRSKR